MHETILSRILRAASHVIQFWRRITILDFKLPGDEVSVLTFNMLEFRGLCFFFFFLRDFLRML